MKTEAIELIELELRYCERCGGLWLRIIGEDRVYCAICVPEMAEFPPVRAKRRSYPAIPSGEDLEGMGEIYGISCAEGYA